MKIRPKDYEYVCLDCGHAQREKVIVNPIPDWEVWTMSISKCDCCGQEKATTHVRDFYYPWHKPLKPTE